MMRSQSGWHAVDDSPKDRFRLAADLQGWRSTVSFWRGQTLTALSSTDGCQLKVQSFARSGTEDPF